MIYGNRFQEQVVFYIYTRCPTAHMPKPELVKKIPRGFPKNATLPAPRWFTVRDTVQNANCVKFFQYWKDIAGWGEHPTEQADLVQVKFYMHWPVVSLKLAEPDRTDSVFKLFEGPMPFENPEDYMTEVPKLLGSGGWHALINELNVHGHLMEAYFSAIELDRYPPKIDLKTLVRGEVKNQDYLRWLAANHIRTPWDNPEEEEEMAGAASDIIKVALDTVKETSRAAVEATQESAKIQVEAAQARAEAAEEQAEEAAEQADERAAAEASIEGSAFKASIDMVSHAGLKAIDMITAHSGSQYDPIALMRTAAELTRPQSDSGVSLLVDAIKDSNAKMLQMQERTMEFMQGVVGIRKNADGSWTQPAAAQVDRGTLIETELSRFKNLADMLGFRRPDQIEASSPTMVKESKPGFWDGVAEKPIEFMTMLTTVVTLGANIVYNMMAPKAEKISPQEALQRSAPPPPIPQAQPQQQPQQQQLPPNDIRYWAKFPSEIEKNFLAHFFGKDSACSGMTFAEWVLSNGTNGVPNDQGRKLYNSIKANLGPEKFHQLISSYLPIWNQVKDDKAGYERFLTEFFNYDEIQAGEQGRAA